jgi:SAM-dependent methyltransferase
MSRILSDLRLLPKRTWQLLTGAAPQLARLDDETRRTAKVVSEALKKTEALRGNITQLDDAVRGVREELRIVRRELRDRLLQYNFQLGRLARVAAAATDGGTDSADPRLSGRTIPLDAEAAPAAWDRVGGMVAPDAGGAEWLAPSACPACRSTGRTVVNPWNKLILLAKAPDDTSARYDYALCHGCGVLYASRRPSGERYRFLLTHFGEVTARRGGGEIANRVLNPLPLDDEGREELRKLAARGVFVSDHLGLKSTEYLAPLLRDRFENSAHADLLGALISPRRARVLEVRSRTGTILDALRRAWEADVYAMPIWESQQFLLREVYGIETSGLIDFDRFEIPFDGTFDVIISNHMFTHVLRPEAFFAEVRRKLKPGGYLYIHNEPDDAEFLDGQQSMLATLNPLHVQAFDQRSLMRALAANGFETVFAKRRNLNHLCLARQAETCMTPMSDRERNGRIDAYHQAYDRAVLGVDEHLRPRLAADWGQVVERAIASGVAEFDGQGQLRLVARR